MWCCPLTGVPRQCAAESVKSVASVQSHTGDVRDRASDTRLLSGLEILARGLRWHGLLELLSAIPESNDDFGLF